MILPSPWVRSSRSNRLKTYERCYEKQVRGSHTEVVLIRRGRGSQTPHSRKSFSCGQGGHGIRSSARYESTFAFTLTPQWLSMSITQWR